MQNLNNLFHKFIFTATIFIAGTVVLSAQIPQNIDPGQEANPPSMWKQPEYIIPVAVIVVLLVGYSVWRRSKRH